jgi:hypothetical protein
MQLALLTTFAATKKEPLAVERQRHFGTPAAWSSAPRQRTICQHGPELVSV